MSDPQPNSGPGSPAPTPIFGSAPGQERGGLSPAVWGTAALIVVALLGIFLFVGHKRTTPAPTTLQPPDAYAAVSLPLSGLGMSDSESLSGGKVTYLNGHIQNTGSRTVTAATVQVVFANDEAMPPLIQTLPLTLVRMTQPYVDTEPVGAEPLKPGDSHDFRLIFESVPANWNQQMPELRIIGTELK